MFWIIMRSYQKSTTGILINLPSGKVSKTGERKPIKSQLSLTCRLYSIRRLAFFSPQYNNALYQAFKEIKYAIAHFNGNFILLVSMGMRLCKQLEIDPYRKVLENDSSKVSLKMFYPLETKLTDIEYIKATGAINAKPVGERNMPWIVFLRFQESLEEFLREIKL